MENKKKIYALARPGIGHIVDADGNIVNRSEIQEGVSFFITTMKELRRAKDENRQPIPLQREPLTIEDMRKIVQEHDEQREG